MTGYVSKRQAAWDKYSTNNRYGTLQWEAFESGWNAALAQPAQEPLTDEAKAVIAAAKVAMDASFETKNRELDISIPAHLATALSLRLDEFEAALQEKNT